MLTRARAFSLTMAVLLVLTLATGAPTTAAPPPAPDRAQVTVVLETGSAMFIENVGQFHDGARFQVRGGNGTIWLADDALWITVVEHSPVDTLERFDAQRANVERDDEPPRGVNIKLSFAGANPAPRLEPFNRLDTVVSYFIGNDPEEWKSDVPVWGGVRYVDLYPGMNLEITGEGGRWNWRLVSRNSPSAIRHSQLANVRLRVDGADALALDGSHLRLSTAIGDFILPLLAVEGAMPDGGPAISNVERGASEVFSPFSSASLLLGSSAPPVSLSTIDDPNDLLYSTFLGGSVGSDIGYAIAVDETGSAYVTGYTVSSDFPTTAGAFDTSHNGTWDAFVVKLNTDGAELAYATFLGGSDNDYGTDIAIDETGSAYVTGWTHSSDFPTTAGALDTGLDGSFDAFVVKLNAGGAGLVYATFLGGSSADVGDAIAVDGVGSAYVTGGTESSDFPTTAGAFDTSYNGGLNDAFVVKLNADGTALAYATLLGGSEGETGLDIAVNRAGSAYVTGRAGSSDFPTTPGAFDTSHNGEVWDAFVVKVNAGGTGLIYATFLGGSGDEYLAAITVDEAGNAYVTGETTSSDFPTTAGAFDTSYNSSPDAFVVKLNADGTGLIYGTFLGGSDWDYGESIAVDRAGCAYVTGTTQSSDFPTTVGAFDTSYNGGSWGDAFSVKLNADGAGLAYATFLGGSGNDHGWAIAVDGAGSAYVTGNTSSSDFPTTAGAFDTTYNGDGDAFVAKSAVGSNGDAKRPVILLPGMSASANWPCFLFEVDCDNRYSWTWMPTNGLPIAWLSYNSLISQLFFAGYTEGNGYMSVLFYDWRKPIADNAATLKARIDELKAATGATEVDLIGHSMGGLVARAYVQGDTFENDVAHLITLGSPHEGAAKAYPYWEAAYFYRVGLVERIAFSVLLKFYMARESNPNPVLTLREVISSFRDILPTDDYLYDEDNGDHVKPEAGMIHRNTLLSELNANLATLHERTEVHTFAGQNLTTTVRFYVHDYPWFTRPREEWAYWKVYWEDGEPNWDRESKFVCIQEDCTLGDETVAATSALLPSPAVRHVFQGVKHSKLPVNDTVISAIFTTLDIPIPLFEQMTSEASQVDQQMIVLVVDGPADATVTDALGQSVGPGGISIPGAEYVSDPSDPFKLILIPSPEEGGFEINVEGHDSGTYDLSLLDTFTPASTVITDVTTLWDTSQSQIESAALVVFVLTYTLETSPTTSLIAETPVIEVPVRVGNTTVLGRALPGHNVEIRDADTHALLGSSTADTYGHFAVLLSASLGFEQRIYPWSNGVAGVPVTAEAYMIYLPVVLRNSS